MRKPNVVVIGNGALTLSVAGQMAKRGACVTLIDPQQKTKQIPVLHFSGAVKFEVALERITFDLDDVQNADIVVVSIAPSLHKAVFTELLPLIRSKQHLLFFPASFGALVFSTMLETRKLSDVTISEAVSYPCVCEMRGDDTVIVHSIKKTLGMSVLPAMRQHELLRLYNTFFDIFTLSSNCIETSLDNINITLHPLPVLMNIGAVDVDASVFRHYMDGVTPHVAEMMEKLDKERMALGERLGLHLTATLEQLKGFYGESDAVGIGEYVSSPTGPYTQVKGFGLNSRYITEDVPYLLVAMEALGQLAEVQTPIASLTVDIACAVNGKDYRQIGYSAEKLGVSGCAASQLTAMLETKFGSELKGEQL